jgi:hypothetical protein
MSAAEQKNQDFDANLIVDRIFLGSEDAAHCSLQLLREKGISHILTVGFGLTQIHDPNEIQYARVKAVDLPVFDITTVFAASFAFIDSALQDPDAKNCILIHW